MSCLRFDLWPRNSTYLTRPSQSHLFSALGICVLHMSSNSMSCETLSNTFFRSRATRMQDCCCASEFCEPCLCLGFFFFVRSQFAISWGTVAFFRSWSTSMERAQGFCRLGPSQSVPVCSVKDYVLRNFAKPCLILGFFPLLGTPN